MRVQRIMCPVDFSESSTAALDDAASLALQLGAQLLIVHVDDHPLLSGAASSSLSSEMAERRTRLEETRPRLGGLDIEHHLVRGKPVEEIPRFARLYDVNLVVMGYSHAPQRLRPHHDGLRHAASRDCHCPVMMVSYSSPQFA
jgi:universal stress protein A